MSITVLSKSRARLLLAVVLGCAAPAIAIADCVPDGDGNTVCGPGPCEIDANGGVYCAPHEDGTVILKDNGEVVCAWGNCAKGPYGGYFCSIEPGGESSSGGDIACVGGCEIPTAALCEQAVSKPQVL